MTDPSGEPIADRPPDADEPGAGARDAPPSPAEPDASERRPALERIGLAAVAVVMAVLFGAVAVAAFAGGEYVLAAMSAVGCMMTLVVGGSTLLRG
jgi:hypothetical protein